MAAAYGLVLGSKPPEAVVLPAPTPAFTLSIPLPDGTTNRFSFVVSGTGDRIGVHELPPRQLPKACPQRHINSDGTFCLGYRESDPSVILDSADAERWWAVLLKFLMKQAHASESGRWRGAEWGHGSAATYQAVVEEAAIELRKGGRYAFDTENLSVRRVRRTSGAEFLRVYVGDHHWYSVKREHGSIVTLRRPCVCGSGRTANSCPSHRSEHAILAARMAEALYAINGAEREFWQDWEGHPCCGTMRDCPLRDSKPIKATTLPMAA